MAVRDLEYVSMSMASMSGVRGGPAAALFRSLSHRVCTADKSSVRSWINDFSRFKIMF